jgi:hypothetical protein
MTSQFCRFLRENAIFYPVCGEKHKGVFASFRHSLFSQPARTELSHIAVRDDPEAFQRQIRMDFFDFWQFPRD